MPTNTWRQLLNWELLLWTVRGDTGRGYKLQGSSRAKQTKWPWSALSVYLTSTAEGLQQSHATYFPFVTTFNPSSAAQEKQLAVEAWIHSPFGLLGAWRDSSRWRTVRRLLSRFVGRRRRSRDALRLETRQCSDWVSAVVCRQQKGPERPERPERLGVLCLQWNTALLTATHSTRALQELLVPFIVL